jgi:hypothetical protein
LKKILIGIICFSLSTPLLFAGSKIFNSETGVGDFCSQVREVDGSPIVNCPDYVVPNGTLTDNLNGTVSLDVLGVSPRIYTVASIAGSPGVLTPEIDTYDYFEITAQAADLNIANKSTSTPTGGEKMIIAITSDATPRALTYGTDYVAKGGVALPSTTVASKTTTLGFVWNAGLSKWNLVAVAQEA